MIEFPTASREFQSLIGRSRELRTLLGSVFAGRVNLDLAVPIGPVPARSAPR